MQTKLDKFTRAYIECALWSSTDESNEAGGEPLDSVYTADDIASETLAEMIDDCSQFRDLAGDKLDTLDDEQSGHDFWLTRNGHGAGFWGRGLGELGEALSKDAKTFGTYDLYVGDDGQIYGQ